MYSIESYGVKLEGCEGNKYEKVSKSRKKVF